MPINLIFSKFTTFYRIDDGTLQKKSGTVRLLEVNKSKAMAASAQTTDRKSSKSPDKRMVKIIGEVNFNLSKYLDQGDLDFTYLFKSLLAPPNTFVDLTVNVQ